MKGVFRTAVLLAASLWAFQGTAAGQAPDRTSGEVRVDVVKQPYKGSRNVPELSTNPDYIHASGLERRLRDWGATLVRPVQGVRLTPEEEQQYGEWERLSLANGHLSDLIEGNPDRGILTVALEANCSSLMGVVGGLQRAPDGGTRRVGVVWLDAHGDFNTPQTTLSGMLGGMPVAISAGHTLDRLRENSGQREPIPVEHIVWGGVRDLDPLEQERFEQYGVRQIPASELRSPSGEVAEQLDYLSDQVDVIYVHVDMDVLAPEDVPGHDLNVPGGPTAEELGAVLQQVFRNHEKAVALGIASTPPRPLDPRGVSRRAALELIRSAVEGRVERE